MACLTERKGMYATSIETASACAQTYLVAHGKRPPPKVSAFDKLLAGCATGGLGVCTEAQDCYLAGYAMKGAAA